MSNPTTTLNPSMAEAGYANAPVGDLHTSDSENLSMAKDTTSPDQEEVETDFVWDNNELKSFWTSCFPPGCNFYTFDGLHPKALCSKICNDVLRTNINVNSGSTNPNDRLLCFEVLGNLEAKFIEAGIVQPPKVKPGGNPNHLLYTRVSHADWNKAAKLLQDKTLEQWARSCVEESIRRLSQNRKRA